MTVSAETLPWVLAGIPEVRWLHGDDECDCVFQRIGDWTNPYLGRTLRVRLCCIWAELYKQFPQFVQEIPAYYDQNEDAYYTRPADWNGDTEMSRALWHRQEAAKLGITIAQARKLLAGQTPPQGKERVNGRKQRGKQTQGSSRGSASPGA